jgi:hypothetical protein
MYQQLGIDFALQPSTAFPHSVRPDDSLDSMAGRLVQARNMRVVQMRQERFLEVRQKKADEYTLDKNLLLIRTTPGSVGVAFEPLLPAAEDAPAAGAGPACCETIEVRPAGFAPFI